VEHRDDVGVREARAQLCLLPEALDPATAGTRPRLLCRGGP
jgi:hypothetical protein